MTALEWLCSKLPTIDNNDPYYRNIFEQAKQMEKEQTEISDDEIFKQSVSAMEEMYGSGCETEIDAYFRGAIWYREQLKNK